MSKTREVMGLCAVVGAAIGLGLAGSMVARRPWYQELKKPPLTPPKAVWGPVSAALCGAMAVSGWMVWKSPDSRKTRALAWFGGQLLANIAWTPLFFGAKKPAAALLDLCLLNAMLAQTVWRFRSINKATTYLLAPYQIWMAFATYLNAGVVLMNFGKNCCGRKNKKQVELKEPALV